jgi:hypothetical protein
MMESAPGFYTLSVAHAGPYGRNRREPVRNGSHQHEGQRGDPNPSTGSRCEDDCPVEEHEGKQSEPPKFESPGA